MTEDDARAWARSAVDEAGFGRLEQLVDIVVRESERQNLVARSTLDSLWARHIVDSLQLLPHAPADGSWMDIGTGAGFPGLAIAAAQPERPMLLIEPRRLRADYLRVAADELELDNVEVLTAKVEAVEQSAAIISARAVSRLGALLASASQCATKDTVWLLPKGRNAAEEVAEARQKWHGVFHVEHSLTNPESWVVIARKVSAK